jgi:two-component system, OmpR family, response regulator
MIKSKILLVEDDPNFGSVMKNYLELHDYDVTLSKDGVSGLEAFEKGIFDLCILDVMMPRMDGFTLANKIREKNSAVPLIFLTAKTMKEDMLEGYKSGADDYVTKPFDSEVLLHKLRAIIRRSQEFGIDPTQKEFDIGIYHFNYNHRTISNNHKEQQVSPKEADLLKLLCLYKNELLPRQKALKEIWGEDNYFTARSMDVFVTKLRKYLKDDPGIDIMNIHGKGFRMIVNEKK